MTDFVSKFSFLMMGVVVTAATAAVLAHGYWKRKKEAHLCLLLHRRQRLEELFERVLEPLRISLESRRWDGRIWITFALEAPESVTQTMMAVLRELKDTKTDDPERLLFHYRRITLAMNDELAVLDREIDEACEE